MQVPGAARCRPGVKLRSMPPTTVTMASRSRLAGIEGLRAVAATCILGAHGNVRTETLCAFDEPAYRAMLAALPG